MSVVFGLFSLEKRRNFDHFVLKFGMLCVLMSGEAGREGCSKSLVCNLYWVGKIACFGRRIGRVQLSRRRTPRPKISSSSARGVI